MGHELRNWHSCCCCCCSCHRRPGHIPRLCSSCNGGAAVLHLIAIRCRTTGPHPAHLPTRLHKRSSVGETQNAERSTLLTQSCRHLPARGGLHHTRVQRARGCKSCNANAAKGATTLQRAHCPSPHRTPCQLHAHVVATGTANATSTCHASAAAPAAEEGTAPAALTGSPAGALAEPHA